MAASLCNRTQGTRLGSFGTCSRGNQYGHWKKYVFGAATGVCFLYDTRLKFLVDGKNGGKGAPMSCAMIYWGTDFDRFLSVFSKFGAVVDLCALKGKKFGECSENGQLDLITQGE